MNFLKRDRGTRLLENEDEWQKATSTSHCGFKSHFHFPWRPCAALPQEAYMATPESHALLVFQNLATIQLNPTLSPQLTPTLSPSLQSVTHPKQLPRDTTT